MATATGLAQVKTCTHAQAAEAGTDTTVAAPPAHLSMPALSQMVAGSARRARANADMASDFLPVHSKQRRALGLTTSSQHTT